MPGMLHSTFDSLDVHVWDNCANVIHKPDTQYLQLTTFIQIFAAVLQSKASLNYRIRIGLQSRYRTIDFKGDGAMARKRWCDDNDAMVRWRDDDYAMVRWTWCDDTMARSRDDYGAMLYRAIASSLHCHSTIDRPIAHKSMVWWHNCELHGPIQIPYSIFSGRSFFKIEIYTQIVNTPPPSFI